MLKALPLEERPRERMLRDGAEALSSPELLAIILGSGTAGKSVLTLSQELLEHFGGIDALLEASIVELMQIKGIGQAKAVQLKAIFALARQCRRPFPSGRACIDSPDKAFLAAQEEIAYSSQELLYVILRDVRACLICCEEVSRGTLCQVLFHPREVFLPAVRHKAHTVIVAHNHPSGDPNPSEADLRLTRRLIEASSVMQIPLIDHLIICPDRYVSLRSRGFIPGEGY
jgi:DNA repair protein RadC